MINDILFLRDLNQAFFNRALVSTVSVKVGNLMSRAVTLLHPNGFYGNKLQRVLHTPRNNFS